MAAMDGALYISDCYGMAYRVEIPSRKQTNWLVSPGIHTVSTTQQGHVLIASGCTNRLFEYESTGVLRRIIPLHRSIKGLKGIQHFDDNRYVLSHVDKDVHRVCLVDDRGAIIKGCGGKPGYGKGRWINPHRFHVTRLGFILVADYRNGRVVLLNPNLEFVKEIIPRIPNSTFPNHSFVFTLFFDEDRGELLVSDVLRKSVWIFELHEWTRITLRSEYANAMPPPLIIRYYTAYTLTTVQ